MSYKEVSPNRALGFFRSAKISTLVYATAAIFAFVALSRDADAMTIDQPMTSDLAVQSTPTGIQPYDPELVKRFPFFFIGYAFATLQFGFSLYGLSQACKNFDQATSSKIACISGAIGTAVTVAGAGWSGWNKYIELGNAMVNAAKKRDEYSLAERSEFAGQFSELFANLTGLESEFVGHKPVTRVRKVGTTTNSTVVHLPTVRFVAPHNVSYSFAIERTGERQFTSILGHVDDSSSLTARGENFDKEHFTKGGIEFTHNYYSKKEDYGTLNVKKDWGKVYDQTHCVVNKNLKKDHKSNNVEFQIYDQQKKGTIGSGAIVAYSNKPTGFHGANQDPTFTPDDQDCDAN